MSSNPHLYLLTRTLRKNPLNQIAFLNAIRGGGGGSFHRPDPPLPKPYNYSRRYRLEDVNTVLYHDFAPEYHMHLHSPWIKNTKEGIALALAYFFLIIVPGWLVARKLMEISGSQLYFAVRPGKDHDHMAPKLVRHLKDHNYENATDFLGRRNAQFYKNATRQEMGPDFKPKSLRALELHGFKF